MKYLFFIVSATAFISIHCAPEIVSRIQELDDVDEGTYEIIQGNCTTALANEMVFHDHVHKSYIPLLTRDATSSWHGDQKIYCLKVLNEKDASKGGTALVKEGGVGHTYVTIEMHSEKGHGLEFTIQIYGR